MNLLCALPNVAATAALSSTLWLVACATAGTAPAPEAAMNAVPAAAQPVLAAVLDDAARRSGAPAARMRVASMQAVTWSDGSLGCPQPGLYYTQALEPGWRIEIAVPGAAPLVYHASQHGNWVWCPAGRAVAPVGPDTRR